MSMLQIQFNNTKANVGTQSETKFILSDPPIQQLVTLAWTTPRTHHPGHPGLDHTPHPPLNEPLA